MKQFYLRNLLVCLTFLLCSQLRAADYYWVGGAGSWSDINHWSTTSGGTPNHSIIPNLNDDVYFDANSGLTNSTGIDLPTSSPAYCRNMNWADVTVTARIYYRGQPLYVYGSVELSASVLYGTQGINFVGSAPATLKMNGAGRYPVAGWYNPITVNKPGSSLTLLDGIPEALVVTTVTLTAGSLDMSDFTHNFQNFAGNNAAVRSLDISNASLTLGGTWDYRGTNNTINTTNSSIIALIFHSDRFTFPKVDVTAISNWGMVINDTSFGELTFTSTTAAAITSRIGANNTVDRLEFKGGGTLAGSGNVIKDLYIAPSNPGFVFVGNNTITGSLHANTPDCDALSQISGASTSPSGTGNGTITFGPGATTDVRNVFMSRLTATGGIALPITVTGVDGGDNTGWDFQPRTTGTTLYWVDGAGDWNDKNHWSASSGGAGGYCVPFTGDDVVFDANSGFTAGNNTVTATAGTAWCHNMTWTNVTGSPVFDNLGQKLEIYGSMELDPTLTLSGAISFKGSEVGTLTANGFNLGTVNFRIERTGIDGGITLMDDITHPTLGIYHNSGKLLMANRTLHIYRFSQEYNGVRTLDISNSTITLDYEWQTNASSNTWVNNGAGSFIIAKKRFLTNGLTYPKVHSGADGSDVDIRNATIEELLFTDTGLTPTTIAIGGNNTIGTVEFKGAAEIRGNNTITNLLLAPSRNYIIRNTQTINGLFSYNNPDCSGLGEMRGVDGTNATLNFGPASTKDVQNVLLQNMAATGTGVPIGVTGADAGGNSGFNITTPTGGARYWVGGSGDWNDAAHWSTTSGGSGGACVPAVNNDVFFDAISFSSGSSAVTIAQGNAYCRNMDWTGAAFAPTLTKSSSLNLEIWGNLVMNPVVTMNARVTFTGPGNSSITSNGSALGDFDIFNNKPTGSILTFADNFSNTLTRIDLRGGGLDLTGRTVTLEAISDGGVATPTSLNITNATVTGAWSYTGAAKTLQAGNSLINASYFAVNGGTYNQVNVTTGNSANIGVSGTTISNLLFSNTSPTSGATIIGGNTIGTLEFKGRGYFGGTGNTIGTLIFSPGKTYTFLGGSNNTITSNWFGSGTPCNPTQIVSSSTTNATVTKTAGTVDFDYIRLNRITAAGVTPFKAREHSVDLGGNVNWDIAPYNNSATILGLGPDKILQNSEFPYTINTDGFFASPLAEFAWRKDGTLLSDTDSELVATDPGTYSVNVTYPDGCTSTDQIVLSRAVADLIIEKTADNMTPAVGSDVVFTLTATNNGPQESTGISVTDLLAAGYTYKSSTPPVGTTYDSGSGVWTIGTLANAANSILTITATVNASGPYVNTATITGPEVDPEPANNTSEITPVPVPTADVSVVKTIDNGYPEVGSNVEFTLTLNNAGPSSATDVTVTDLLPNGYTYVSSVVPAGTTYDPLTGLWSIGTLAKDGNAIATITATVKPTGIYTNTASVTLTENDPETGNNSATVTPVTTPLADLSIIKTVNDLAPYAGNNIIFTLTAENTGPSRATGVQVNDLLPTGYTFVSATPSVGTYNPSTGIWTIGTLASAANATLAITATIKDAGVYTNTATITGTETDPDTVNNASTVTPTPIIIKITKTGPSTVNAGAGVQYSIAVKNTGTGNALAAVISDIVTTELTNVSWSTTVLGTATVTSGATGTGNNISVTGNIPAGAANQIDISVSGTIPAASLASSISNTATATAPGSLVISSNTVITSIGKEVDLHIQKTGPATIVAGSSVVYTLNVTNTGPSDASNMTINDNVPAGLNNVSWTAVAQNGAVINGASTGTGNVNLSAFIPAGTASISVTINGTLNASYAGTTLVNTATAVPEAGVTDPTPASGTVTSTVSRRANVRIVKSGPANIGAGENISYTIRVTNDGPSTAAGIEIKDVVPAQVLNPTWTATVQNGATLSSLSGTGNIDLTGDLPAGNGLIEILVDGQVDPALLDSDTFSNTATADLPLGSPVTDPELSSNTSTIQTTVNNIPDIRVSKNGPATVSIGDPITYTIVITNGGGGNVTGALIEDDVPASVTVTNWDIIATGGAVVTGATSGTTNTINTTGDIPASAVASLTLTIQGTVNVNAAPTFTNTATVTAGGVATSSVTTAVNQSTDIVVEKNGPQAVIAGRPISYTIKLGNAGPQNAQGLILDDAVPTEIENVSWSAAIVGTAVINGSSSGTSNAIQVNADVTAGAGNYILVTVNGLVRSSTQPSTITNTASVSLPGALTDFDLTNNTSIVETVVSRETNLAITKAVDNVGPDVGSNVVFTLTAINNGPSDATAVVVTDLLPTGYTYVSSAPGAGTSYDQGTGEWAIGTLANTASSTLTITASVNGEGPYANTATIRGTEPDPIMVNNTATVTPVPAPVTDLIITKTADNMTPDVGSTIVFELIASNNGPSAGTGVSVTDLLPTGYNYLSSTPSAGTIYDPVTGVWTIGTLANAASSTLTVTATVKVSGTYTNTATISGTENDPATGNNLATISPVASAVTDLAITKTADNLTPNAGSTIVFTVVATNNGPSNATGVTVTDLIPDGYTYVSSAPEAGTTYAPSIGLWSLGTLANGDSYTLTVTATLNASGDYINTATISGSENDPIAANNTATTTVVPQNPAIALVKTASIGGTGSLGDDITYTFTVTNIGDVTLTGVRIDDALTGSIGLTVSPSTLAPGEVGTATASYTITQLDIDAGNVSNTATVTAITPNSSTITDTSGTAMDNDDPTNTPLVRFPEIMLWKEGTYRDTNDDGLVNMGDHILFSFTVENTGNIDVMNVTITDPLVTVNGGPLSMLATGASDSTTFTAEYVLTQEDIDVGAVYNIAAAEAEDINGDPVTAYSKDPTPLDPNDPYYGPNCADCTITVLDQQPSIALIKYALFNDQNNDGYAQIGETITYSFSVVNTGNAMLTDIMVSDLLPGITMSGGPIDLAPGATDSTTFSAVYTITEQDIINGNVTNQASVSGKDARGTPATDVSDDQDEFGNSPTVIEIEGCTLTVHNALSPNNDGMNDFLHIKGIECYPDNTIQIYNRWGALVFEAKGYNNSSNVFQGYSDGRSTINRKEALPSGTYFYVLHINKSDGTTTNKKGYLNINR